MSNISNYKPADYYWMHSKGEYVSAAIKGMTIGTILGALLWCLGQALLRGLFPWLSTANMSAVIATCAAIGGIWQIVLLKREDVKAKQANFDTAIDVLARSILAEEEGGGGTDISGR